jgi:hypothetical protein
MCAGGGPMGFLFVALVLTCLRIGAGFFVFCVFHKEINISLSLVLAKEFNKFLALNFKVFLPL